MLSCNSEIQKPPKYTSAQIWKGSLSQLLARELQKQAYNILLDRYRLFVRSVVDNDYNACSPVGSTIYREISKAIKANPNYKLVDPNWKSIHREKFLFRIDEFRAEGYLELSIRKEKENYQLTIKRINVKNKEIEAQTSVIIPKVYLEKYDKSINNFDYLNKMNAFKEPFYNDRFKVLFTSDRGNGSYYNVGEDSISFFIRGRGTYFYKLYVVEPNLQIKQIAPSPKFRINSIKEKDTTIEIVSGYQPLQKGLFLFRLIAQKKQFKNYEQFDFNNNDNAPAHRLVWKNLVDWVDTMPDGEKSFSGNVPVYQDQLICSYDVGIK